MTQPLYPRVDLTVNMSTPGSELGVNVHVGPEPSIPHLALKAKLKLRVLDISVVGKPCCGSKTHT